MSTDFQAILETLPEHFQAETARFLQDLPEVIKDTGNLPEDQQQGWAHTVVRVIAASPFVAQTVCRQPHILSDQIADGSLFEEQPLEVMEQTIHKKLAGISDEQSLATALRQLRYIYSIRIAWRDLAGWADLTETLNALSKLADILVSAALARLHQWEADKIGTPTGELSNKPVSLYIFGLGKLGGNELNFSSDIDLIFFYPEDGETRGASKQISNHEFFTRLSKKLIKILSELTKDGFVFRVDMRLRPNGKAGPLAMSFAAAENYYVTHGREWERYAWIKARLMTGDEETGKKFLNTMKPFVYRKYLDYGTIEAIRSLKESINRELSRKQIKSDIKRGPGGIREIEFIGQVFQLIRGGRDLCLQERSILKVLNELRAKEYITARTATGLSIAYDFLRRTEHRLQMMAEQQTHALPADRINQERLAFSMGFSGWLAFKKKLDQVMGHVHSHFDLLIAAPQLEQSKEQDTGLATVWSSELDQDEAIAILEARGYTEDAKQVLGLLAAFHNGSAYKTFTSQGQERFDRLMPQLLAAAGLGNYPEKTLARLLNVMEAIGRRSAYLALLIENPLALSQLVKLCSASPWIAEWISLHPLLLDELLNPVSVAAMPGKNELAADLAQLLNQYDRDDLERLMEVLREFCNRHVLHLAAAEVGPGIAANVLGRQLSNIADVLIGASLDLAIEAMTQKHGTPQCASGTPGFVVVGYGKLGGHELGFGSDVDIIFLHNNCTEGETDGKRSIANETYFARVTQRLIHILSTRTFGGILYEVDARLRPSGKSGPIVTSLDAFLKYQQERAWTWEYQALVRARPVAGDSELAGHFMEARQQILCQKREPQTLKKDVREMRAKMLASQKPHAAEEFDVKHDRGGIVDVEFMVQYWVLVWAHDHPGLTQHTENCAILRALAEAGLIEPALAQVLLDAYQGYLSTAYHLKLMHAGTRIKRAAGDALGDYPDKVLKIWQDVMEQDT